MNFIGERSSVLLRALFFGFMVLLPFIGNTSDLAVLYPDVRAPYTRIFDDIKTGIRKECKDDVKVYVLSKQDGPDVIEEWLRKNNLVNIVALGNQAMNLALELPERPYMTVAGAVLSAPKVEGRAFSAITMAPDPDLLFEQLRKFSTEVKTVSVVYQFGRHEGLIDRANEVASAHGLVVAAHGTDNARDGANLFRLLIDDHVPGETAIWLLQDVPALKERSVLQSLLRTAWDQKILVFSSNPSYVKKGALFSLFPNNVALGRRLVVASLEQEVGGRLGARPSRELDSVLNARTAEHLGLGLSRSRRRKFDIVFPSE